MFLNFSRQTLNKCAKKTNLILINSEYFSTKFNIDKESKKHGGELVASVLKIYDTRHEVNAVFAADAVARLRQHIGVAAVTSGP
uniref:Thiamine pyrophosphate enzyme N-terminal TPP-binding domain-containing protein n=1 Tax=Meloidogyne javanica TaxID=6303 RepID=A0A915LC30_MELJA